MANLTTAYAIINGEVHAPVRAQVEMGMWFVARQKALTDGVKNGPEGALIVRVLRGDRAPVTTAIYALATDVAIQDSYVAGGNKLTDAAVITFLTSVWGQVAGIGWL